ncbi:MAG: head decoration protein [Acutalibacteraceae bacterium]
MNLNRKIGEMDYDNLVIGLNPKTDVRSATIRKLDSKSTIKRGTILAKSSADNKCVILGTSAAESEKLTPFGIVTDDIEVGTEADVVTTIYTAGCFNTAKCIVAEGYTIKDADFDELRKFNIVFQAAQS